MLDRRSFIVTVMLFIVVFVMFMLVNVTTGLLTKKEENQWLDIPPVAESKDALIEVWEADSAVSGVPAQEQAVSIASRPMAALIVSDPQSAGACLMREWCVYQKYRYRFFTALPSPEEVDNCSLIVLGDVVLTEQAFPLLTAYAVPGKNIVCLRLPDYAVLSRHAQIRDYFGIKQCVSEDYQIEGMQFAADFFLCGTRIYAPGDDYGKSDDDVRRRVPYYLLRSGYQVYAFGLTNDASIHHSDYPPILWRTYTGGANVFVVNCADFDGKKQLGILTALLSHSDEVYVYPVVNARTVSMLNFPLMNDENADTMYSFYSRSVSSISRDVLWPGIDAILRNYGTSYNYFACAQMGAVEARSAAEAELLNFYRQEIAKHNGVLGLSLDGVKNRTEEQIVEDAVSYFREAMPSYGFSAVFVPQERLEEALAVLAEQQAALRPTLILSHGSEENMLLRYSDGGALTVRFTTDGFAHESMDDLEMVCVLSALGMDNQAVDMKRIFFPTDQSEQWFSMNTAWSSAKTYLNQFEVFDSVSVHEMEDRTRAFLTMNYRTDRKENGLDITMSAPDTTVSLIMRLYRHTPGKVENAEIRQVSDTAWLLTARGSGVIHVDLEKRDVLEDRPVDWTEVTP